jgi:hypothetical protein
MQTPREEDSSFSLRDLINRYHGASLPHAAYNRLRQLIDRDQRVPLDVLLNNPEFPFRRRIRNEIDSILKFYSIVELACIVRFVGPELPSELEDEIVAQLGYPPIYEYFTQYHPQILPQLLLKRIKTGEGIVIKSNGVDLSTHFAQFLSQVNDIENDGEIGSFLSFVVGERRGPETGFLESISALFQPRKRNWPDTTSRFSYPIQGMFRCYNFMIEFHGALDNLGGYPIAQSAFCAYYEWFQDNYFQEFVKRTISIFQDGTRQGSLQFENESSVRRGRIADEDISPERFAQIAQYLFNQDLQKDTRDKY